MPRLASRFAIAVIAAAGLFAAAPRSALAQAGGELSPRCLAAASGDEIAAARDALDVDPRNVPERLTLASVLTAQACYVDAVKVLEAGRELHPDNRDIELALRDANSLLEEQRYFTGLDRAEEEARLRRNLLRCRELEDLNACTEAIRLRPGDASVHLAAGDANLKSDEVVQALLHYREAQNIDPDDGAVADKLAAAEAARQERVERCVGGTTDATLEACNKALLRGSADEFRIQKRRGAIFQATARPSRALDAFIAAMTLRENDESVARAVVALSDEADRDDALTLQMRGRALLVLGRSGDALNALQAALAVDPALDSTRPYLASARQQVAAQAREAPVPRAEPPPQTTVQLADAEPPADPEPAPEPEVERLYSNAPLASDRSY